MYLANPLSLMCSDYCQLHTHVPHHQLALHPPAAAAVPGSVQPPPVTTNSTGATFQLSLPSVGQAQALKSCNALGGHLASYLSFTEQQEVGAPD